MKYVLGFYLLGSIIAIPASHSYGQTNPQWTGSFLPHTTYMASRTDESIVIPANPQPGEDLPTPEGSGVATETYENYSFADASHGFCEVGCQSCCAGGSWFGGVYGLIMTREDNFDTILSHDAADSATALGTNDAATNWTAGVEVSVGRYIGSCWGVQFSYWGFGPSCESTTVYDRDTMGGLFGAFGYGAINYDSGSQTQSARTWYGDPMNGNYTQAQRICRDFGVHNFELNFIRNPHRRCRDIHFELLTGFRYLYLDEGLNFSTAYTADFGINPADELTHSIDVENHLAGFQLGGRVDKYFYGCWGLHLGSKFGLYNNHVRQQQQIYGTNGYATVAATGDDFDFGNNENNVAFLGELFTGASYDFLSCCRLTLGYRAVAACGVADAASQFPRDREFDRISATRLDSSDCLLLHGAYAGIEYNW